MSEENKDKHEVEELPNGGLSLNVTHHEHNHYYGAPMGRNNQQYLPNNNDNDDSLGKGLLIGGGVILGLGSYLMAKGAKRAKAIAAQRAEQAKLAQNNQILIAPINTVDVLDSDYKYSLYFVKDQEDVEAFKRATTCHDAYVCKSGKSECVYFRENILDNEKYVAKIADDVFTLSLHRITSLSLKSFIEQIIECEMRVNDHRISSLMIVESDTKDKTAYISKFCTNNGTRLENRTATTYELRNYDEKHGILEFRKKK